MSETDWGRIWWSHITGPRSFIGEIASALYEDKSAILLLPGTCPWRQEMRSIASEVVVGHYGFERLGVERIRVDAMPKGFTESTPHHYLLEKYALHDVALRYRESMDSQNYLVEHDVLKNRIIWLEVSCEQGLRPWVSFVSKWRARSHTDGLFVVEVPRDARDSLLGIPLDNITVIDYGERVSGYSGLLFNSMLVDDRTPHEASSLEQRYLASLLTNLCRGDMEVSEALSNNLSDLRDNPIKAVIEASSFFAPSRGIEDQEHIFSLARAGDRESLRRRVWSAQAEVLLPLIESLRLDVVETLRSQLEELILSREVRQYEKPIERIEDIELGSLVYLMALRDDNGRRVLDIPDQVLRDEIYLLRNCRNELAHTSVCSSDQVNKLFAAAVGHR